MNKLGPSFFFFAGGLWGGAPLSRRFSPTRGGAGGAGFGAGCGATEDDEEATGWSFVLSFLEAGLAADSERSFLLDDFFNAVGVIRLAGGGAEAAFCDVTRDRGAAFLVGVFGTEVCVIGAVKYDTST